MNVDPAIPTNDPTMLEYVVRDALGLPTSLPLSPEEVQLLWSEHQWVEDPHPLGHPTWESRPGQLARKVLRSRPAREKLLPPGLGLTVTDLGDCYGIYNPNRDWISLDWSAALGTFFHELAHASGASGRCDRRAIYAHRPSLPQRVVIMEERLAETVTDHFCRRYGVMECGGTVTGIRLALGRAPDPDWSDVDAAIQWMEPYVSRICG